MYLLCNQRKKHGRSWEWANWRALILWIKIDVVLFYYVPEVSRIVNVIEFHWNFYYLSLILQILFTYLKMIITRSLYRVLIFFWKYLCLKNLVPLNNFMRTPMHVIRITYTHTYIFGVILSLSSYRKSSTKHSK